MNEILAVLRIVREDKNKLTNLHEFMMDEIYEEPEPEEIPEKYKKVVFEIAGGLLAGLVYFFNPETLEVESIPKDFAYDPEEFEVITGETMESAGINYENWQKCIEIEPMESRDSFKIMEYFIDEVENKSFQDELIDALNRKKPFANFKYLVENFEQRQQWFDFRRKQWEYYVWGIISKDLE